MTIIKGSLLGVICHYNLFYHFIKFYEPFVMPDKFESALKKADRF
jgi:hypothetical protein